MKCTSCGTENPEGATFCMNCAVSLALICPECGTELPSEARFCYNCAAQVAHPALSPSAAVTERLQRLVPREFAQRLIATRGQISSERRVVTMLFSDVKGSTPMAEKLDPEEYTEIMDGAFDVLIEPITRYEGALVRLLGDGILAFFGAPIAHEDDPERACRAELEIVEGARAYAVRLEEERAISGFDVRVGIHTGLVVVGEVGSDLRVEYTAMGDAVNVASRMEEAAEPGTVLITEDTHRLIALLFETEALGPIQVKGKAEPISAHRVLAPKVVAGKPRGIAGLVSPLVGREAEFCALLEALERLQAGVGGIVTIVGEAGIGKSRLVAELRSEAASLSLRWVEGRCLSYGTSNVYSLWLDVLRALLGVTPEDGPGTVRARLREQVRSLCPDSFDQVYPYLARLMTLPLDTEEEASLLGLQGERLRSNTYGAVDTLVGCLTDDRPLVLVCEDLHWADPVSLELMEHLLALADRASVLFICAFRPYTEHGCWRLREISSRLYYHRHLDLRLERLSADDSRALVGNLLHTDALPRELRQRVLAHAEGNPFYVEEIIRSLIHSRAIVQDEATGRWEAGREVSDIAIPDTLQGVLTARIDRLEEGARRVLQLGSVIGRILPYRVLSAVSQEERGGDEHSRRELSTVLLILQREQLIRERARTPELEYIFKHELTRDAAYNGLLRTERRRFHRWVAEAIESLYSSRIEEQVDLLAHHWERAEQLEKASDYLLRAGDRALQLSAYDEAIAHLTKGLELLRRLADSPAEHASQELQLQIALAATLQAAKGWVQPEAVRAYDRARDLCEQLGDVPQLVRVIFGLWTIRNVRGELRAARELAEQLLAHVKVGESPVFSVLAHYAMGVTTHLLGELTPSAAHLNQVISAYDPQRHRSLASLHVVDRKVGSLAWRGLNLWLLGYFRQALQSTDAALVWAQELGHPFSVTFALLFDAYVCGLCRDVRATRKRAEELIALASDRGFQDFVVAGSFMRGWALAHQDHATKGVELMRQGLTDCRARGLGLWLTYWPALLSEGLGLAGQIDEGLAVLSEALETVSGSDEHYFEAELHRLRGELLLMGDTDKAEVECHYRWAVEIARRQRAKSWELRANMSLCRLWKRQEMVGEAWGMLLEIYEWFTEGFDTGDLRDAQALLEELSNSSD